MRKILNFEKKFKKKKSVSEKKNSARIPIPKFNPGFGSDTDTEFRSDTISYILAGTGQRVKNREGKTQIFCFWAGQSKEYPEYIGHFLLEFFLLGGSLIL
jgi:hypothetical protein